MGTPLDMYEDETEPETKRTPSATPARPRGFAAMDPETRRAIASKGGVAAHRKGTAHKWTAETATAAGKKGGAAPHRSRGKKAA